MPLSFTAAPTLAPIGVPSKAQPCTFFDLSYGSSAIPVGWPIRGGTLDDVLCPDDWWNITWLITLRTVLWPLLFLVTLGIFFVMSCFVMPRINGRRDTTGLCGKLGTAFQARLDAQAWFKTIKRGRNDTWEGKLNALVKHFSAASGNHSCGTLSEDEFIAMFTLVGDRFVNATMYRDALGTFGSTPTQAQGGGDSAVVVLDIAAIEAIYSAGLRTWREKHVQIDRDYERLLLLTGVKTHSDLLVVTSSIGPEGLREVHDLTFASTPEQHSVLANASANVKLAAQGGKAWGSAVDEEFSVESAMTEAQRFSVALPSLYIETWIFTALCAYIFFFGTDLTRWASNTYFPAIETDAYLLSEFTDRVANMFRWDVLPRTILEKLNVIFNLGHKVCLFHFLFIAVVVLPLRVVTVLAPASSCAKALKERLKPHPLAAREWEKPHSRSSRVAPVNISGGLAPPPRIDVHLPAPPADAKEGGGGGAAGAKRLSAHTASAADMRASGLVPVECVISARKLTACDKWKMRPLYFLRDVLGIIVAILQLIGLSLNLFVVFACVLFVYFDLEHMPLLTHAPLRSAPVRSPFIDFQRKSIELSHLKVSGVSFQFQADPWDAYMRWLNLKMVDMLSFGWFERIFRKKAKKMYLGYLDQQVRFNVPPTHIPAGFDTARDTHYFAAVVHPLEWLALHLFYLPLLTPCCGTCFPFSLWAKHRATASWKLFLSKIRIGGRQPVLGGNFKGAIGQPCINVRGFMHATKLNLGAACLLVPIDCLEKKYELALEERIEWVVPPPSKKCPCSFIDSCLTSSLLAWISCNMPRWTVPRWTYLLLPFPFDIPDETDLALDVPIPVIVDHLEEESNFDFHLPLGSNPNALTAENVAEVLSQWINVKAGVETGGKAGVEARRGALAQELARDDQDHWLLHRSSDASSLTIAAQDVEPLISRFNKAAAAAGRESERHSSELLSVGELQEIVEALALLASDLRCASPIFVRLRASTSGRALFEGLEQKIIPRGGIVLSVLRPNHNSSKV